MVQRAGARRYRPRVRRERYRTIADPRLDEARLLAEAGFFADARALVGAVREAFPSDPEAIGLEGALAHRAGAISEALHCWRNLQIASPHGQAAIARLASIREEEEGKRGLGPSRTDLPLVRKAIRHVADGHFETALSLCAEGKRLAAAAADKEQHKLLTLLESLIHEVSGRYGAAAYVLEGLGRDPTYAHDPDRLALLARVSESAKDREGLVSAERVLDFLTAYGKLSAFERLAQVRRALGNEAGARQAEESFEEAFRRRMHWLAPRERLAALQRRPLPLYRLRPLRLPGMDEIRDPPSRGIALLARGRVAAAERFLSSAPEGWAAVHRLAAGRVDDAAARASAALLAKGEPDGPLACILMEAVARIPGAIPSREVLELARRSLERMIEAGRPDEDALRHLATLEERGGDREAAARHAARLAAARERGWPPPGVVRAAAVYAMPGKPKGLVHDIIARRQPAAAHEKGRLLEEAIHGELPEPSRAQVRRTFAAVREWLLAVHPERSETIEAFAYGIHVTKEDEPSGGPSLGLPVAMAFASAMLGIRIPSHLVFTGAISYDSAGRIAVLPVGDVELKLKGALHAGASTLVLPGAQREEALAGSHVPRRIAEASVAFVATMDEALAIALRHTAHRAPLALPGS